MKQIFSSLLIFSILITYVGLTSAFALPSENKRAITHSESTESFYSTDSQGAESSQPLPLSQNRSAKTSQSIFPSQFTFTGDQKLNSSTQSDCPIPKDVEKKCERLGIKILKYIVSSVGLAGVIASTSRWTSFSDTLSGIAASFAVVGTVKVTSNILSFIFRV